MWRPREEAIDTAFRGGITMKLQLLGSLVPAPKLQLLNGTDNFQIHRRKQQGEKQGEGGSGVDTEMPLIGHPFSRSLQCASEVEY